jgi:xylulokinase
LGGILVSLLGIDVGTTGCKAVVFNKDGDILASQYQEHSLFHPNPGWAELDPNLVFKNIKSIIKTVNQRLKKDKIKALAISSQGEAVIPADRYGECLYNAIVTFDGRTGEQYQFWKEGLGKKAIFEITGMPLNPMYSINKIMWLKKYRQDIYKKTFKFLCFEDFVQMKFGVNPTISYSLAARTSAFDIRKKKWSKIILEQAQVEEGLLAMPGPSAKVIGVVDKKISEELGLDSDVAVVTGGHDQACGAYGAGIIKESIAMNASGTSDVITVMLDKPYLNKIMLDNNYPCAPYVIPEKYTALTFNLTGGLLLKWYRDTFCYEEIQISKKTGENIYKIIDNSIYSKPVNLFILPHFVGSGTPTLDSNSRGIIMGLDLETDKSRLSRAVLESNAYDLRYNLEKIESIGINVKKIIAIGGGASSSVWLQIKSNVLNKKMYTLINSEAASLGAALLAGIATGQYRGFKEAVVTAVKQQDEFVPDKKILKSYEQRYKIYKEIYSANKSILHEISMLN